ncbi:MAG: hypothetical protein AAFO61_04830 [Pseudomonadota bacterium]
MHADATENLDLLIAEEKSRVAQEVFHDAWQTALDEGIEVEILAEVALANALTLLHGSEGVGAVETLLESVSTRLSCGHFDPDRKLQ